MKVTPSPGLPDVLRLEMSEYRDDRGSFAEMFNAREFAKATGVDSTFVQDNYSSSNRNVIRGLHYQIDRAQGKLVWVVRGELFDVAVDLRRSSPTFGRWTGQRLSEGNKTVLWIPPGFAHGFLSLSDGAGILYKTTDFYSPLHERCVSWNDPDLAIDWPVSGTPIVSERDRRGVAFKDAETYP